MSCGFCVCGCVCVYETEVNLWERGNVIEKQVFLFSVQLFKIGI